MWLLDVPVCGPTTRAKSRGGVKPPPETAYKLHLAAVFDGEAAHTSPLTVRAWTKTHALKLGGEVLFGVVIVLLAGNLAWFRSLAATVHYRQYCMLLIDPLCCG